MIADRDIRRAANLLIREHSADVRSSRPDAHDMAERGDHDGKSVWLRNRRAIVEMQATPVGKPN